MTFPEKLMLTRVPRAVDRTAELFKSLRNLSLEICIGISQTSELADQVGKSVDCADIAKFLVLFWFDLKNITPQGLWPIQSQLNWVSDLYLVILDSELSLKEAFDLLSNCVFSLHSFLKPLITCWTDVKHSSWSKRFHELMLQINSQSERNSKVKARSLVLNHPKPLVEDSGSFLAFLGVEELLINIRDSLFPSADMIKGDSGVVSSFSEQNLTLEDYSGISSTDIFKGLISDPLVSDGRNGDSRRSDRQKV
jgi:hypothetical protein